MNVAERLLARSVLIPICGCRLWEGYLNPRTGYGEIHVGGKVESTHRAAFQAFVGDPAGKHVLHRCDVRSCINPYHLFLGSNADNIADSVAKGRRKGVPRKRPFGLRYNVPAGAHDVKLKIPRTEWSSVARMLTEGKTQREVAAIFGVHPSTISHIKTRLKCVY